MDYIKKLIELETSEVGMKEEPKGSNKTIYNKWYYGTDKSAPWCMIFQQYCCSKLGIDSPLLKTASCGGLADWAKKKDLIDSEPAVGDLMVMTLSQEHDHVGLIYKIDTKYIYTIEGNTSETKDKASAYVALKKRTRKQAYCYIKIPFPADVKSYKVKRGDSLWSLAKQFYGEGRLYTIIKEYNKLSSDCIKVGQNLLIPERI